MDGYGLDFLLRAPEDEFLRLMSDIDESYVIQEEHDVPIIPPAERLEYALCAYHKALEEHEIHLKSLKPGQNSEIKCPSYRGFAAQYDVKHTTLMRRYKGKNKSYY